ncbi:MAG TPA: hypothetical protein VK427_08970 [Kofleriaceae bacterium]|nr:hypothetical protein [Kofleriaceae bacterium]
MFTSRPDSPYARALARCTFGAVLGFGAVVLLAELGNHAAIVICTSWGAATLLYKLVAAYTHERHVTEHLVVASFVWPSVGVALLAPLTLHMPFFVGNVRAFDDWAGGSVFIAGPAHVACALFAARRAGQLVRGRPAMALRRIYWLTVLVSCIPFAALFMIPPIIVMLTGLPMLAILGGIERLIERERTTTELPVAIALSMKELDSPVATRTFVSTF